MTGGKNMPTTTEEIRRVTLLGPDADKGKLLWVARLATQIDHDLTPQGGLMRNASVRVLAQAAQVRGDFKVDHKKIAFHDPFLLSLAIRPEPTGDCNQLRLISNAACSAYSAPATATPIDGGTSYEQVQALPAPDGRWPDPTTKEIETPPLRLATGELHVEVEGDAFWKWLSADKTIYVDDHKIRWRPVFGSTKEKRWIAVRADGGDLDEHAPEKSTGEKPDRLQLTLTATGIEFAAMLLLDASSTAATLVVLRLAWERGAGYFLQLVREQDATIRNGLDAVTQSLRLAGLPVQLRFKPGVAPVRWPLVEEGGRLSLRQPGLLALAPDAVMASVITEPEPGATVPSVAAFNNPRCSLEWAGAGGRRVVTLASGADPTPTSQPPHVQLNWDANTHGRWSVALGSKIAGGTVLGDVDVRVDMSTLERTADVADLALERGVLRLPRHPTWTASPRSAPRERKDAIIGRARVSLRPPGRGVSILTTQSATQATAVLAVDIEAPQQTTAMVRLGGAVGTFDGALWAYRAAPSAEALVPTLDAGPIALQSLPLRYGVPDADGLAGSMSAIHGSSPPNSISLNWQARAPGETLTAWLPHPGTMPSKEADPVLPPLVTAMDMTRLLPGGIEPSGTRDLLPRSIVAGAGDASLTVTLTTAKDALLPLMTIDVPDGKFTQKIDWDRDSHAMSMVALTLPGIEYTTDTGAIACLRFDLPLLDEFQAMQVATRPKAPAGKPLPTALRGAPTAEEITAHWNSQIRRRALARTQSDIWWRANAPKTSSFADLVELELSAPTIEAASGNGLNLGKLTIEGISASGEKALSGWSETRHFRSGADIVVVGGAVAPYPVAIGAPAPVKLADGENAAAFQDTRGYALARTAEATTNTISLRKAHRPSGVRAEEFALLTTLEPSEVQFTDSVKGHLAVRDLPVRKVDKEWRFASIDTPDADGSSESAFDADRLGRSIYEWRHYPAKADGLLPLPFDISWGALRLKPLRLDEATFDDSGNCLGARIRYAVCLARAPATKGSPYGEEDLGATGNTITLSFKPIGGTLRPVELSNSAAPMLTFTRSLRPGSAAETLSVTFSFALQIKDHALVPVANSGVLELSLFGSQSTLESVSVTLSDELDLAWTPSPETPGVNLRMRQVKVSVPSDGREPTLTIDAALYWPVGQDAAVTIELVEREPKLQWFGFRTVLPKASLWIDHRRGLLHLSAKVDSSGSLFRGAPQTKSISVVCAAVFDLNAPAVGRSIKAGHLELVTTSDAFEARQVAHVRQNDEAGENAFDLVSTRLTLNFERVEYTSAIDWPLAAWQGKAPGDKALIDSLAQLDRLPERNNGQAFVTMQAISTNLAPIVHKIILDATSIDVDPSTIHCQDAVWRLAEPLRWRAWVQHRLVDDEKKWCWNSIEDVTIVDADALYNEASKESPLAYGFSPRYRSAAKGGHATVAPEVPWPGIVKTHTFGQPLVDRLANLLKNENKRWQGLIWLGGAVHEVPLVTAADTKPTKALTFGLPWLFALTSDASEAWPFSVIRQAPANGAEPVEVNVALFDAAAGVAHTYREEGRRSIAVDMRGLPDGRGAAGLADALAGRGDDDVRPVDPLPAALVDQAFASNLTGHNGVVALSDNTPIYWRTLFALKRWWFAQETPPAGNGNVATLLRDNRQHDRVQRLLPVAAVRGPAPPAPRTQWVLLGRGTSVVAPLPATLTTGAVEVSLLATAAQATLPGALLAIVASPLPRDAVERRGTGLVDDVLHHHDNFEMYALPGIYPAAVPRPLRPAVGKIVYPSPTLGWPDASGLEEAGNFTLTLGQERVLQDSSVAWAGRARRLSGLVSTEASAPASGSEKDRVAFLALGQRVLFERQAAGKEAQPVIRVPPDRSLMPVAARTRAPLMASLQRAFTPNDDPAPEVADLPQVANFTPGHYELVTTGVRPGVMVVDHEGWLLARGDSPFDSAHTRLGRPAHRAPIVWHHGRSPRSTGLPTTDQPDARRRTWVGLNIRRDSSNALSEVLVLEGAGEVIRYAPSAIGETVPSAADGPVAILVQVDAGLDRDPSVGTGGLVQVRFTRPAKGDSWKPLIEVLRSLRFLHKQAHVTLRLDGKVLHLRKLVWLASEENSLTTVTVSINAEGGGGWPDLDRALQTAGPDSRATLEWTAAGDDAAKQDLTDQQVSLELDDKKAATLLAGPPRSLSVRLPLRSPQSTYLPTPTAVAIFGDPDYDRTLAGPAKTQRKLDDRNRRLMLSVDRPAYDAGETVYFAAGVLNPAFDDPTKVAAPFLTDGTWTLNLLLIPVALDDHAPPTPRALSLGSAGQIKFESGHAYAIRLADLSEANSLTAAILRPGDQLRITVTVAAEVTLTVTVIIADRPVIAPPAAVYGLLTLDQINSKTLGTPALFASAPLPSSLEFPDLLGDLARGHVRRRALFRWRFAPRGDPAASKVGLVKIDRTGGGQIPTDEAQFETIVKRGAT